MIDGTKIQKNKLLILGHFCSEDECYPKKYNDIKPKKWKDATQSIGQCVNGLCPAEYDCVNNTCYRSKYRIPYNNKITDFNPFLDYLNNTDIFDAKQNGSKVYIGPCINSRCPQNYTCDQMQYKCYKSWLKAFPLIVMSH